jgi:hypothetical protein
MARKKALQCPFCDNYLIAPVDINFQSMEICGGICTCRAVYALDRSGHNMGEIFMDALTFVCKGDVDKALSLAPEDYETSDYDYDVQSNTIRGKAGVGKLSKVIFVRLKESGTH